MTSRGRWNPTNRPRPALTSTNMDVDARGGVSIVRDAIGMNTKLLLKTVVLILLLLLLVLIGLNNRQSVAFLLPPLINKSVQLPAALMYFVFFAVGLLAGTLLTAGGGRKGGTASKPAKSDR